MDSAKELKNSLWNPSSTGESSIAKKSLIKYVHFGARPVKSSGLDACHSISKITALKIRTVQIEAQENSYNLSVGTTNISV